MCSSPFELSLQTQVAASARPRCTRDRRVRWAHLPELLGGDVDVLAARLTSPSIEEQNPVFAALIRLHLAGDEDATTILLHGSIGLVHRALPTNWRRCDHTVGSAWTTLALTLSDFSDADLDVYMARGRPLMGVLYGRFRRRLVRLAERERPSGESFESERLAVADGWGSDPAGRAIDLIEVARVTSAARSCGVTAEQWAMVVNIRVFGVPAAGRHRTMVTRACQRIRAAAAQVEVAAA